jgi:hypothetical protein
MLGCCERDLGLNYQKRLRADKKLKQLQRLTNKQE